MNNDKLRSITANQIEEGDTQSASIVVPVTITANQYEIGDTQSASITVEQAVEIESRIPPDAKQAVKDFIEEQIHQINETVGEFTFNIPEELGRYMEIILEIIQKIIG